MSVLDEIKRETKAARQRTGKRIGLSVSKGLHRVEEIVYAENGVSTVIPLSERMPLRDCIEHLKRVGSP